MSVLPVNDAALNHAFYWAQRQDTHSKGWVYRYATNDEITANHFRGQNHTHVREVPFTYPTMQTGGHCEPSRCVIQDRQFYTPRTSVQPSN